MSERLLPDWIDTYLFYVDNSEPPEMFKLWTAISCIASCMQRKCWLNMGLLTFFPNMYIVLVGPSGCRKGTAMSPGYDLLTEINVILSAEATTRESLIRELRKTSDTYIHPVSGKQDLHCSLTIFSQELTVFLGYGNMQLMSDLTDWYDCRRRWNYSCKTESLSDLIVNVWVNLIGATTPTMIQSALPSDAVGLGLTSRMIFVYEQRKGKSCPAPFLTQAQQATYDPLLHDLEMIKALGGQFTFTSESFNTYTSWYTRQEQSPPFSDERLLGYIERRPNHLLKLCMIMSASRSDEMVITMRDFERALHILLMTERKMSLTFGGVGKAIHAGVMNRLTLLLTEHGEMSYEEVITRFGHDLDLSTLNKTLDMMEMGGNIKIYTDGRRKKIVATEKLKKDN